MAETRRPTRAAGAVIQRALVRRKIKQLKTRNEQRVVGSMDFRAGYTNALDVVLEWLDEAPSRLKRKGGIGRA